MRWSSISMPGEDGLSVCLRLGAQGGTPILLLTALGDETDRIIGLITTVWGGGYSLAADVRALP